MTRIALPAEPERQFDLVKTHIRDLRTVPCLEKSPLVIFVERNLGFEAEHIHRALRHLPLVHFYRDEQASRTGILTTDVVKLAAVTLTNVLLRERRLALLPATDLVARDPSEARRRLREQLEIYSFQFKSADTIFQKERYALSGKVGGLKDDIVICLQLGIYWTESCRLASAEET